MEEFVITVSCRYQGRGQPLCIIESATVRVMDMPV